jgi:hypothetical protein
MNLWLMDKNKEFRDYSMYSSSKPHSKLWSIRRRRLGLVLSQRYEQLNAYRLKYEILLFTVSLT